MRIWLSFIVAILVAGTAAHAQQAVRIGTSSTGSVYYTLAVGASELVHKYTDINATAEPVGGSAANVVGLGQKNVEFAVANSFASYTGFHGTYRFKEPIDVRLVLQGQPSFRYLLVRKGADIDSPQDLAGRTIIAKRRPLPELELVMNAFIERFDLPKDSMDLVATTNTGEAISALRAGSVDGAVLPFSQKAGHIEEPMRDGVTEFLYISEADRDAMLEMLPPNFFGFTVPANDWSNQKQPVHLFALNTYFITRPGVSEETVYQVAKAVLDHNEEFQTYHANARHWTAERSVQNISLPFHPGAVRYYKEAGLWNSDLEQRQAELLNR